MDVFDEDLELDPENEADHLKQKYIKDGYREGVTNGQEYILQSAFNGSFTKAADYFDQIAWYRGALSATLLWLQGEEKYRNAATVLEEFLVELENYETNEMHVDKLTPVLLDNDTKNNALLHPIEPLCENAMEKLTKSLTDVGTESSSQIDLDYKSHLNPSISQQTNLAPASSSKKKSTLQSHETVLKVEQFLLRLNSIVDQSVFQRIKFLLVNK